MEVATSRARLPVETPAPPGIDPKLWILTAGRFLTSVAHSMSFPFFAIFVHLRLGVPLWIVGAIIFTSGLLGAFSKYLSGILSDRFGRKPVMVVALFGRTLATAALGVMAMKPDPAWTTIAMLFISGTFSAFLFDSACHAMVADLSEPKKRIFGYSLMRTGGNLGWAVGTAVGGLLGAYSTMFLATSVATAVAFLMLVFFVRESLRRADRVRESSIGVLACLRTPGFLFLCLGAMFISMVMAQLIAPLSVYAKGTLKLPDRQVGWLFTLNGLVVVLLQFPMARWISRFRLTSALVAGCALYAVGFALAGWTAGFFALAACVLVVSVGETMVAPSTMSMSANLAPEAGRGRFIGVYGSFEMFGRCLGPLLGGIMLETFVGRTWVHWAAVGVVALIAAGCYGSLRRRGV